MRFRWRKDLDNVRAGWIVVSDGWTYGDEAPASASLELSTGQVIPVGVNSYLRKRKDEMYCEDIRYDYGTGRTFGRVLVNGGTLTVFDSASVSVSDSALGSSGGDAGRSILTLDDLAAPLCADGVCVQFEASDDGEICSLAVTQYSATLPFATDSVEIELIATDAEGAELGAVTLSPEFDDELSVLFGVDLAFTGNPVGQSLSGKLSLLGTPNRKGKAATLAKGKFYATSTIDDEGWLVLAGVDKDAAGKLGAATVKAGAALTLVDGADDSTAVPPLAATCGNGSGTRAAATSTSTKPQLL